jgi:serpin B
VLANAIVFKGTWEEQFKPESTATADFQLASGASVPVAMMHKDGTIAHGAIPGGQVAVLAFKGEDLSMVVLVPDAKDGLPTVEAALTSDALAQWIGAAKASELNVALPRFGISYGSDLVPVLKALGVGAAFDLSTADFSAMDGARDLYVGAVVHKAVVTVDEQGAEAAAATGVEVRTVSMPPSVIADHPFLFLIYDHVTQSVLFMGRMDDPSK